MKQKRAIVIGGGSGGCATAHDLALRGLEVVVVERGEIASGTTGRCSCYVHPGARYAVNDRESAVECIEENHILRKIMPPGVMEENQGAWVQCPGDDPAFVDRWFEACAECGIVAREIPNTELFAREPNVSRDIQRVAIVPDDAVVEPLRLTMAFAATAQVNGARFLRFTDALGMVMEGNRVTGVRVRDRITNQEYDVKGDIVVNAAGPWANKIADMAGAKVTLSLSPGVQVILGVRITHLVIDRLHKPSSGDFLYPLRNQTILGTSSWSVQDCDHLHIPEDHIQQMLDLTSQMVPGVKKAPIIAINAATRPLVAQPGKSERELSRRFECFDHELLDNIEGFVTIAGGKMATCRAVAEAISDLVSKKMGVDAPCQTRTTPLISYRRFYAG